MAYTHDEEAGVLVDDDGYVFDDEDGEYLGTVAEFYGDTDNLGDDLSNVDIQAIYQMAAEDQRAEMMTLQREIAADRERYAAEDGYRLARKEDEAEEYEAEQAEAAFQESLDQLATRLGRNISETEAEQIAEFLPEERGYTDEDVSRAAANLGMRSFTERGARGRESRAAYISSRAAEMEQTADENYQSGAYDEVEDGGGMYGHFMRDESDRQDRLAQSTSTD